MTQNVETRRDDAPPGARYRRDCPAPDDVGGSGGGDNAQQEEEYARGRFFAVGAYAAGMRNLFA